MSGCIALNRRLIVEIGRNWFGVIIILKVWRKAMKDLKITGGPVEVRTS
jgi:hypothetical protein